MISTPPDEQEDPADSGPEVQETPAGLGSSAVGRHEPLYPVAVLSVLMLGGFLRLWGVSFGLPALYHWDEKMYFHGAFYAWATGGRAESLVYGNVPYMLLPIYWLIALFHGVSLDASGLPRLIKLYLEDPSLFYLFGRTSWVVLQVLGIWLCYRVGWRALSRRAGLVGAGFLAVAFLAVSEGHYVKGDATAMVGAVLTAWAALHLMQKPSLRWYAAVGAAAGLSVAFKPYTFALVLIPVLAHWLSFPSMRERFTQSWKLFLSAACALLAFVGTLPAPLVDLAGTLSTFRVEAAIQLASVPTGGQPVWLYYWTGHLLEGLGWPLELAGVAGLVLWLVRRDKQRLLLLALPLLLWLGIVTRSNGFARYALPMVPFICLAAGDAIDTIATWAFRRLPSLVGTRRRLAIGGVVAAIALLVALPSLDRDFEFGTYAASPDTRTAAANWVEAHLPAGASVVEEGGQGFEATSTLGPPLRPSPSAAGATWSPSSLKDPTEFWNKPLLEWLETYTPTYRLTFAPSLTRRGEITTTTQWGTPDAFVMISWRSDPERGLPASPLWADLAAKYKVAAVFDCSPCFPDDPYAWAIDYPTLAQIQPFSRSARAGPRVWVYTRETSSP